LTTYRHRRALALAALLAAGVGVAVAASPGSARHATLAPGTWCGGLNWRQLTFSDVDRSKVDTAPIDTNIQAISQMTPPAKIGLRRWSAFQRHTWRLEVVVDRYRIGSDGEIVLVLYSIPSAQYMDAYLANPQCLSGTSRERQQMVAARQELVGNCARPTASWQFLGISAIITGVGYWNPVRTTKGALSNGAELRPLTGFQIVSGCGFPKSPAGP
jgi:hypothetical protein